MSKFFFLTLFSLLPCFLLAQKALNGRVSNPQGEALAFVSVLVNDAPGGKVILTDIEGRFSIPGEWTVQALSFRYVGYEAFRVEASIFPKNREKILEITLTPKEYAIGEVLIRAGENPADILMRKAIARRKANNPDLREAYRCKTYNKVVFDAVAHRDAFEKMLAKRDTSKKANRDWVTSFKKAEKTQEKQHLFLMESVTERRFRFPDQVQEKVLLNRVSGFENAGLVAIANMVQPFSFYGDFIHIMDKNYANPVSPGSPERYFFNIEDTLRDGRDTIWVISFKPRKGKVFDALEGVINLHANGWAVQNVRAKPAFPNPNMSLKIEQAYKQDSALNWFPEQLNFEMEMLRYPGPEMGLKAAGRSYVRDIELNPDIRQRDFDPEMPLIIDTKANNKSDSAWTRWRELAPLNDKEWRTYAFMDSLGQVNHFDRWLALFDYLGTGRYPLYKNISLDLTRLIQLNDYERVRLGVGLTTAPARALRQAKRLEAGAYSGYGIRDKGWKYGAYGLWRINRGFKTQLRASWQSDLREPGTLYELDPTGLFNRAFYAKRMDATEETAVSLSSRLWRGANGRITLRDESLNPRYDYRFASDGFDSERFHFQEISYSLRYAWKEDVRALFGSEIPQNQKIPVLELAYTQGNMLGRPQNASYSRAVAALSQNVMIRRLGRLQWRLEAGQLLGNVPMSKLFTLNQSGGSGNFFAVASTFQALPDTLFLADRFANLFFSQELGPVFYQRKYSAPQLTLLQNIAWGELRNPELQQEIGFAVARTPYYESGLRIDRLLRFNYVNFMHIGIGAAVFYKWGFGHEANWEKNLRARLALKWEF